MSLDPVTLEVLVTKVSAVAEEMGIALQRSGRTIYVKETEDFGTGLMNLAVLSIRRTSDSGRRLPFRRLSRRRL